MTDRNLAIRLSVMDGGKVKAELQDIGDSGQKSLQKIELAASPASTALQALNAASSNVKGRFEEMTGSLGPLGSALSAIGPYGLAAGAAFAIITETIGKSLEIASEAEQSYNRLTAVLKATGDSSGLTASEIVDLSKKLEASTLTTSEKVQDATAILSTFRSVSGDTFTRAITLAQDMSAVFGRDLSSSAMQLGKALEDPVNGLTSLRRVGVVFTQDQRDLIKSLAETGQTAEAQKVILDALQAKVGGSGAAVDQGLAGASHGLAIAWKNMLESIGETSVVSGAAEGSLKGLAAVLNFINGLVEKAPLQERLSQAKADLADAQKSLDWLQNLPPLAQPIYKDNTEYRRQQVEKLRKEVEALTAEENKEAAAQAQARAGADAVQRDQRAELLTKQKEELDKVLDKLVTDPAAKIEKINQQLVVTRQNLENLREKDGSNNAGIDAAITEAQKVAQGQIDAIQKPLNDAAQKAAEANQKVIIDLQEKMLGLSDKRQQFIDQAISRLSSDATAAQIAQTRKLAAQLFDEEADANVQKYINGLTTQVGKLKNERQAAIDQAVSLLPESASQQRIDQVKKEAAAAYDQAEAQKHLNELQKEGKQLMENNKSATQTYADQIQHLKELLDAGAISQDVYNKAMETANANLLNARTDAAGGALQAFHDYQAQADTAASAVKKAFTSAMAATDDAITSLITSSGNSLQKLENVANSIVTDITKMIVQQQITGPLFNFISGAIGGGGAASGGGSAGGSFFGDLLGSIFHEGGVVGDAAPSRRVPAYVFAGAPRYHSGGIAGLQPGEIPAILQRGEVVLPKGSTAQSNPVNVIMNITTPDAGGFRASQAQIAAEAARNIKRANRNL